MEVRLKIIFAADLLFKAKGAKPVTMDEIAANLGISKKTLYGNFSNKAEVVQAVTQNHFEQQKRDLDEIHKVAHNPVHEIILIMEWMSRIFKGISPQLIYDIQRYYPDAWNIFHEFKNKDSLEMVRENLEKGILAGLYRVELDIDILSKLRIEEIGFCLNENVYPPDKFDFPTVSLQLLEHFLHGVVTIKGKKMINKYLNRVEEE